MQSQPDLISILPLRHEFLRLEFGAVALIVHQFYLPKQAILIQINESTALAKPLHHPYSQTLPSNRIGNTPLSQDQGCKPGDNPR